MIITENRLRRIIRDILVENDENKGKILIEDIEKGKDFADKCINWCENQHFTPSYFFKDEVIKGFDCVYDLTFKTKYENIKDLYRDKLSKLKNILKEKFDSKKETRYVDSAKFSRLLMPHSSNWMNDSNLSNMVKNRREHYDHFYVRSFSQEDISNIKEEIKKGEQEYDVSIYDDPDLSNDEYQYIEKSRSSPEYQKQAKKFEDENPNIFKENLDKDFIVITRVRQVCDTEPEKKRPRFGTKGKPILKPTNESDWEFSILFVCRKGDDLVIDIKNKVSK